MAQILGVEKDGQLLPADHEDDPGRPDGPTVHEEARHVLQHSSPPSLPSSFATDEFCLIRFGAAQ